jgi:hypothetical protein
MIVEDLILVDTKTQDRHLCKIREKNGNFILKIYDKNEIIRILNYVGKSTEQKQCRYREQI